MAIIIQQLENVINILESTRPAGEQIINSLAVDCVAKVQHKDPYSDQVNIMDLSLIHISEPTRPY